MSAAAGSTQPRRGRLARAVAAINRAQVAGGARERRDLAVLLAAIAAVALPHFEHLETWAAAILTLLWGWRAWLVWSRRPPPGRIALSPLLVATCAAVWLQFHTLLGREAGVTLLLLLLGLKLLEIRARRDVYVVVLLGFFVMLAEFIYSQSIPVAAASLAATIALFFVLLSVQLPREDLPATQKLRRVLVVFAQALPLAAIGFVLFPRLDGPLWGSPDARPAATTGLSDTMTPGAISRLAESDRIVFRVHFDGKVPPEQALYWRGPVLSTFDGRTWTPGEPRVGAGATLSVDPASAVDYEVTLEPLPHDWLFAIDAPAPPVGGTEGARVAPTLQLLAGHPVTQRYRYRMRSYLRFAFAADADAEALRPNLLLPPGSNPRATRFARDLARQLPETAEPQRSAAIVAAALEHFRTGGYRYTLQPPALGADAIDELMFSTRLGFCEHFAAAFVFLMRASGVPARVVTGYQGGELNPADGFLTVRDSDAHAWAEVWIAERGWTRVDPTGVVAPLRVERGARAIGLDGGAVGAGLRVTALQALRSVRMRWEAIENGWNQWFLSYTAQRQRSLMSALGFAPTWRSVAGAFTVAFIAALLLLAPVALRSRAAVDPLARIERRLRSRLAAAGVPLAGHAGLRSAAALLAGRLQAADAARGAELLGALESARYAADSGGDTTRARERRALAWAVWRYRPRAATPRASREAGRAS